MKIPLLTAPGALRDRILATGVRIGVPLLVMMLAFDFHSLSLGAVATDIGMWLVVFPVLTGVLLHGLLKVLPSAGMRNKRNKPRSEG